MSTVRTARFFLSITALSLQQQKQDEDFTECHFTAGNISFGTILNHSSYLEGLDDHQWYLDNIPFIDTPDKSLQEVYYYRTSVIKRHLKWVAEGEGWVVTEFIHPVSWSSKFQTTPDSAPHQVVELRWLRDLNYNKDVIQQYTRGGVEKLSG
ncbi:hypothetical protein LTR12_004985 [Friedmanniomyces endolithicus]|nr:hypothetical protein LTR12_004985 [Friedmanniomyces endolithicus]